MRITTELLTERNACESQVALFGRTFPKGATVTLANLAKARKAGLDIEWLGGLLPEAARAEYEKARAFAWAEYAKATAAARAEYEKARAFARAEYEKARAFARAEYDKVMAPAWAEYEKARDRALVAAFRKTNR